MEQSTDISLRKTWSRALRTSDWAEGSPSNSVNVLEWPSQIPDLNLIEHLWRDLKMAVHPSNLTKLERICREEWQKIPKSNYAKLVASYPRRLKAIIPAKGASAKY